MPTEIHRGRLIDHIQLVVRDIEASRAFYTAVFETLQVPMDKGAADHFFADELFISIADSEAAQGELTGRHHIAFQARDRAMVDAFHRTSLHGGKDNGKPGERPYPLRRLRPRPDGNNIEAVYHGPAQRSAESMKFTF